MNYRKLGKTGLKVSEIGYGAWGIGKTMWIGASDDESVKALHRSIDLGLNFIDTALGYGDGHSEKLVGKVVNKNPSEERRLACQIGRTSSRDISGQTCDCLHGAKPEKSWFGHYRC